MYRYLQYGNTEQKNMLKNKQNHSSLLSFGRISTARQIPQQSGALNRTPKTLAGCLLKSGVAGGSRPYGSAIKCPNL